MTTKVLGKIKNVDVKLIDGYMLGINFDISINGGSSEVNSSVAYAVNISDDYKWDSEDEKLYSYKNSLDYIKYFLKEAKVEKVQDLKNKPVKVTLDGNCFKDFRILTEVL